MTYADESDIAQRALAWIASNGSTPIPGWSAPREEVKAARIHIGSSDYVVHRHGNSLRFSEESRRRGEIGRFLIVDIIGHQGGWMLAVSARPPGEFHDERAAEQARQWVEYALSKLGYEIGTPGQAGQRVTPAKIEREINSLLASSDLAKGKRPRSRGRRGA